MHIPLLFYDHYLTEPMDTILHGTYYWRYCVCVFVFLGYYCLASTDLEPVIDAVPCPASTYGDRDGLTQESECSLCQGGYYCPTDGEIHDIRILLLIMMLVHYIIM